MNVNSFQDREYVNPCQAMSKQRPSQARATLRPLQRDFDQNYGNQSKNSNSGWIHFIRNIARLWISSFTRDQKCGHHASDPLLKFRIVAVIEGLYQLPISQLKKSKPSTWPRTSYFLTAIFQKCYILWKLASNSYWNVS